MTAPRALTAAGEAEWFRLKERLALTEGFALGLVFSEHPLVVEAFRARLAEAYRARVTGLESLTPTSAETLVEDLIERLTRGVAHLDALDAPLWVDLSRGRGPEWTAARSEFLARLNERRDRLGRQWNRPIVFVFPAEDHDRVRRIAPDLWAIRQFTLFTEDWIADDVGDASVAVQARTADVPLEPSPSQAAAIEEWRRIASLSELDEGARRAGARAYDSLKELLRWAEAADIAVRLTSDARVRAEMKPNSPEVLRDLSLSLKKVGDVARAFGDMKVARSSYAESVALDRRILTHAGDTPAVQRDLSGSLARMGDVALALGELEAARTWYAEGQALSRRILTRTGETLTAQQDLSFSLARMGDVARALGEWASARSSYEEGLALSRRILMRTGETPKALRGLSLLLDRMGDVACAMGEWEAAKTSFEEGLALSRRILTRTGETPEALRDLAVFFERIGDVDAATGRKQDSRQAWLNAQLTLEALAARLPGESDYAAAARRLADRIAKLDAPPAPDA